MIREDVLGDGSVEPHTVPIVLSLLQYFLF